VLVNAAHVKQVPGRKTDVATARGFAQLVEHGLVRGSFVPPRPIRDLRDLTRYRTTLTHERVRHANRLHKVLEDAGLKLATVASDILGVSGRAMLGGVVAGTTDPAVLAELARGRLRTKLPALRAALAGRFRGHHAFLVSQMLAHLDYLEEAIATVTTQIEEVLRPFAAVVERLDTIPGISRRVAEVVVAEIGTDMTAFPSDRHLASLGRAVPGPPRERGRQKSGRTRKGNRWLRAALVASSPGRHRHPRLRSGRPVRRLVRQYRPTTRRSSPSPTRSS